MKFVRLDAHKYRSAGRQYNVTCSTPCKFFVFKPDEPWYTIDGGKEFREQVNKNIAPTVGVLDSCEEAHEAGKAVVVGHFAAGSDSLRARYAKTAQDMQREGTALKFLRCTVASREEEHQTPETKVRKMVPDAILVVDG